MLCSMRVEALEGPLCVGLESQWLRGKHRLNSAYIIVVLAHKLLRTADKVQ